jgi:hypothetical protein
MTVRSWDISPLQQEGDRVLLRGVLLIDEPWFTNHLSLILCCVVGPTTHKFGAPPIRVLWEMDLVIMTMLWRSKVQQVVVPTFLTLWLRFQEVQVEPSVLDQFVWNWTTNQSYSALSAYKASFHGQCGIRGARVLSKTRVLPGVNSSFGSPF